MTLLDMLWLCCDTTYAKTVTGHLSTDAAKETLGQYVAGFYFHGK